MNTLCTQKQMRGNKSSLATMIEENDNLNKEYATTQQSRMDLVILIEQKVKECNDSISKENELLTNIQNKSNTISSFNAEQEKLKLASKRCIALINSYNVFEESNTEYIESLNKHFEEKWNTDFMDYYFLILF